MTERGWQSLVASDHLSLTDAREQLHQAVQLVAAVARSYHPEVADDHFANLGWSSEFQALISQPIESEGGNYQAALQLDVFKILFIRENTEIGSINIAGKTQDAIIGELKSLLSDAGFEKESFGINLPYEIPEYSTAKGATFTSSAGAAFRELSSFFHNSNLLLQKVEVENDNSSPVRCWPHHFDIATLITLKDTGDPETSSSIGVGLSPGDGSYNEPYFYVTPWPYPEKGQLPELSQGHWHTEGFVAAILKSSDIIISDEQEQITKDFLRESVLRLKEMSL